MNYTWDLTADQEERFSVILGSAALLVMCGLFCAKCCICLCRKSPHEIETKEEVPAEQLEVITTETDEICAICIETYSIGDKIRILPCKHFYHRDCISQWLTIPGRKCPNCRASVGVVLQV